MKRQVKDSSKHQQLAWNFFRKQQKLKELQKKFDDAKVSFEAEMEDFFRRNKIKSFNFECDDETLGNDNLVVKMIERTSIVWDAEKLEKRLPKSIAKKVIKKQYRINDMQGLITYLKSCNVDPVIFKKYIQVEKTVDQKAVDHLGNIGQISVRNISGCYIVKCQKPYFTLSVKKGNDGDGE